MGNLVSFKLIRYCLVNVHDPDSGDLLPMTIFFSRERQFQITTMINPRLTEIFLEHIKDGGGRYPFRFCTLNPYVMFILLPMFNLQCPFIPSVCLL